jgi:hypothetical protein
MYCRLSLKINLFLKKPLTVIQFVYFMKGNLYNNND